MSSQELTTDALPRDRGGVLQTHSGRWHVFRRGQAFACAKGSASHFEAAPIARFQSLVDESGLVRAGTVEISERLQELQEAGETVCLQCASCYSVEVP